VGWLVGPILAGFLILLRTLNGPLGFIETVLLSIPVGSVMSSYLSYFIAYHYGVTQNTLQISLSIFAIISITMLYPAYKTIKVRRKLWIGEIKNNIALVIMLLVLSVACWFYFQPSFQQTSTEWHTRYSSVATLEDNLAIIQSFVQGINNNRSEIIEFPKSPFVAGKSVVLSFLPHYHQASLIVAGLTESQALHIITTLYSTTLLGLLYCFYQRYFQDTLNKTTLRRLCVCGVIVAVFAGGVGALHWLLDYRADFRALRDFNFLERTGPKAFHSLFWSGMFSDMLLENIGTVYAYPLAVGLLILLHISIAKDISLGPYLRVHVWMGFFLGVFPLLEWGIFIFFCIFIAGILISRPSELRDDKKYAGWFVFIIVVVLVSSFPVAGFVNRSLLVIEEGGFFRIATLWRKDASLKTLTFRGATIAKPFILWLKALGVFLPLSVSGLIIERSCSNKRFGFAAWLGFLVLNFIRYSPDKFEVITPLQVCVIILVPFVLRSLELLSNSGFLTKIIAIVLFVALVSSGIAAVAHHHYSFPHELYNSQEFKMANWIRNNTHPSAVFMSSPEGGNIVSVLAGRAVWATKYPNEWNPGNWTELDSRLLEQQKFLNGEISSAAAFLNKNQINYILLDPKLRDSAEPYLDDVLPIAWNSDIYKIYSVVSRRAAFRIQNK